MKRNLKNIKPVKQNKVTHFKDLHAGDKFKISGVVHVRIYLINQPVNFDGEWITRGYNAVVLKTGNSVNINPDQEVEPALIFSKGNYDDRI